MDFTHAALRACSSLSTVSEPILSREALRLGTHSGEGWYSFGEVHLVAEVGWDECLAAFERSLACNPSHVAARQAGRVQASARSARGAVWAAKLAMRLSVRDRWNFIWLSGLARALPCKAISKARKRSWRSLSIG